MLKSVWGKFRVLRSAVVERTEKIYNIYIYICVCVCVCVCVCEGVYEDKYLLQKSISCIQ
jgi:hypothetical protein